MPDGMDEIGDIVNMLLDARESSPLYFRILTTTDCNASCAYCYGRGWLQAPWMPDVPKGRLTLSSGDTGNRRAMLRLSGSAENR